MSAIRIFKFGGASVKNAEAVKNVASILRRYHGEKLVVVISAMGKMTNALETLHRARFHREPTEVIIQKIRSFHFTICQDIFKDATRVEGILNPLMDALQRAVQAPCSDQFDMEYDQLVGIGEWMSTSIVHAFLKEEGMAVALCDARTIVRTDDRYRDARVDWVTSASLADSLRAELTRSDIVIIQGFIGATANGKSTTLGREGSDFTAAILAYLLDAKDVTIWKDVPGMLNADPKWFKDTVKLERISFHEAIELAYYGASVIHPKTIKPLQNKGIPLFIKSFLNPDETGSVIQENMDEDNLVPSFIFKDHQVLISITPRDFSFVVEDNLREIFDLLVQVGVHINLMENSAISFSICVDADSWKLEKLFELLSDKYSIRYNEGLTLLTIRHYDEATIKRLTFDKDILAEQRSRQTVRMIMR